MNHSTARVGLGLLPRRLVAAATVTLGLVGTALITSPAAPAAGTAPSAREGKGATRVAVAPRVAKIITGAGIAATPTGDAKAFPFKGTVAFRFPITGTSRDGKRISHSGGVKLSDGHEALTLERFRINLRRGYVSAWVNRDVRTAVFNIAESHRPQLGPVRLTFNRTAAAAVNQTFGVHVFRAGQNFGYARVNPA